MRLSFILAVAAAFKLTVSMPLVSDESDCPFYCGSGKPVCCPGALSTANLRSIGVVEPQWRYTTCSSTHFRTTTREVLCIASGRARLCFDEENNHGRAETEVDIGHVVTIPAGVGNRRRRVIQYTVSEGKVS
ncbi:uncharacterized protein EDB93DRAFT_1099901 [Suillus bovinus]|uniref:uncharacterized protein n=1 Tax=Suillus bovinus TaxID=48563 RepID=UPI001B86D5DF|nr:uncharacterized protein EDB93DRAFT_1099901 [Suillus bovinus]KAG2159558.1 hypothetical protein EDB93DRAFT_1099901 [Suillus bovinus]